MARAQGCWNLGQRTAHKPVPANADFVGLRGLEGGCEQKVQKPVEHELGTIESLGRPTSGVRGVRSPVVSRSPRAGTRNPSIQVAFALLHDRRRSKTLVRQPSAGAAGFLRRRRPSRPAGRRLAQRSGQVRSGRVGSIFCSEHSTAYFTSSNNVSRHARRGRDAHPGQRKGLLHAQPDMIPSCSAMLATREGQRWARRRCSWCRWPRAR